MKNRIINITGSAIKIATAFISDPFLQAGTQEMIDGIEEKILDIPDKFPEISEVTELQNLPDEQKEYVLTVSDDMLKNANLSKNINIDLFDATSYVNSLVEEYEEAGNERLEYLPIIKKILAIYLFMVRSWVVENNNELIHILEEYSKAINQNTKETRQNSREIKHIREDIVELNKINSIQSNQIEDHESRIQKLEKTESDEPFSSNAILNEYYKSQVDEFTSKNESNSKVILGDASLAESYIIPLTKVNGDDRDAVPILDVIENWVNKETYGIMLLYGDPGDGKTSLCKKAVYDFVEKNRFQNKAAVMQFPLSNWEFLKITKSKLALDSVFYHDSCGDTPIISIITAKDTLIFLDGYDEVKLELQKKGLQSYKDLYDRLLPEARRKNIHFIITSRKNAVSDVISDKDLCSYKFEPLTIEQQEEWCYRNSDYQKRWDGYYKNICQIKTGNSAVTGFQNLLKIPFVFRMSIHSDYRLESSSMNQAMFYHDLFLHTMKRLVINSESCKQLNNEYQTLAYKIWCYNTDTAVIKKNEAIEDSMPENADFLLFSYYLKEFSSNSEEKTIGFLHRSFYQYYMALFLYNKMLNNNSNDFIKLLAERRLDEDILRFFSEIVKNQEQDSDYSTDIEKIKDSAKNLMSEIAKTECIVWTERKDRNGNAEKSPFVRCNNIFWNSMRLCFCFDIADEFNKFGNVKELLRRYDCIEINVRGVNLAGVNLSKAYLGKADLSGANLSGTILIEANLFKSKLNDANLRGAHLNSADLSGASMNGTLLGVADLSGATLTGADLSESNLTIAHLNGTQMSMTVLRGANLNEADLSEAYMIGADLRKADLNSADLYKANMDFAKLFRGALKDARNVDTAKTDKIIWFDPE